MGFANVIDAFHNVNQREITTRFFADERRSRGGIALTDELLILKDDFQYRNLPSEVEARWRLVGTAWSLNLSPDLLVARYDPSGEDLYVVSEDARRVSVISCRNALKLKNLKWLMIASKLGGVGYGGGIALGGLRNSYPEAYKRFQEELRG